MTITNDERALAVLEIAATILDEACGDEDGSVSAMQLRQARDYLQRRLGESSEPVAWMNPDNGMMMLAENLQGSMVTVGPDKWTLASELYTVPLYATPPAPDAEDRKPGQES